MKNPTCFTPAMRIASTLTLAIGLCLAPVRGDEERREAPERRPAPPEAKDGHPRPEGGPRDGERPRPEGGDHERKLHALKQAAQILAEAGLQPQAMALREQAEHLMRESREHGGPRPPQGGGDLEALRREVAELREIVSDLKNQFRGHPEGRPEGRPEGAPEQG